MRVERSDRFVQAARVVVVEQEPHAHAALRRLPQGFAEQAAGRVGVPDVVLHVEAAFGGARKQYACSERIAPIAERMDGGLSGVGRDGGGEGAGEARAAGIRKRVRRRAFNAARQAGAAPERGEQAADEGAPGAMHLDTVPQRGDVGPRSNLPRERRFA